MYRGHSLNLLGAMYMVLEILFENACVFPSHCPGQFVDEVAGARK